MLATKLSAIGRINKLIARANAAVHNTICSNPSEFKSIVSDALIYISEKDFAKRFGTSISTITRWKDGVTIPHSVMRPVVYKYIIQTVKDIIIH